MYFDPGTGSLIIQMLLAAIAGVGAFFVTFKTNFLSIIAGKKSKKRKEVKNDKK